MGVASKTNFDPLLGGGGVGVSGGGASNNSYYMGVKSPVNNSSFSGVSSNSYSSSQQTVATVESASGSSIAKVVSSNGETLLQSTPLALVTEASQNLVSSSGGGDNTGYSYYTDAQKQALSSEVLEMVNKAEQFQKFAQQVQENNFKLKSDLENSSDGLEYVEGQSLPRVLSNNAKSLTNAINSLTISQYEQFSLLNNNMMALLIYFDQFLSNQALGVSSLSKLPSSIQEIKPDYSTLNETLKKLQISPNISVQAPSVDVKVETDKLATSLDKLVKDDTMKELIKVQQATSDSTKEYHTKQNEKAEHQIEALEFDKKSSEVTDTDGEKVLNISPRDARHLNNVVTSVNQTDEKNVEYDDLSDPTLPFEKMPEFVSGLDIIKEYAKTVWGAKNVPEG